MSMHTRWTMVLVLAIFAALAAPAISAVPAAWAQEPAPAAGRPPSEKMANEKTADGEIVEQILELQRRIEELIRQLSPAGRRELERRLAEAAAPGAAERSGTEGTAGAVVETAPTPTTAPAPTPAPEKVPETPRAVLPAAEAPERCDTLRAFDSNGDGVVNASDRYWRYLYLWIDGNGDGQIERSELESAFERGVRGISVRLDTFTRAKGADGLIRIRDRLVLDLRGDGFGGGDDAVLAIDATSLSRGTGPRIFDAAGEPVTGIRPFEKGWTLRDSAGRVWELLCR